jgi:DNA replicative helicase MCM subunit Mcm2 (Cdc46/Mcm family)
MTQVLSAEAKEELQDFYLQLRSQVAPGAATPITVRCT